MIFQIPWFLTIFHNLKLMNANISIWHEKYAKYEFEVYVSTDADFCWTIDTLILIR